MSREYSNTACEELIKGVPGVISSKIVKAETGVIDEVHVIINESRHPKQISKDVQSILATRLDELVDYRKISIAQTRVDFDLEAKEDYRIHFKSVNFYSDTKGIHVEVKMLYGDEEYVGQSDGINTERNTDRLIGMSTIDCVEKIFDNNHSFLLEDIDIIKIAKTDVVVVGVNMIFNGREELLIGTALAKTDRKKSIVRATLDAINRKLEVI